MNKEYFEKLQELTAKIKTSEDVIENFYSTIRDLQIGIQIAKDNIIFYQKAISQIHKDYNHLKLTDEEIMEYINGKSVWFCLKDAKPTVEKNGTKVLIHRILTDNQSEQNPSIYPVDKIHLCVPEETWWTELPELPKEFLENSGVVK